MLRKYDVTMIATQNPGDVYYRMASFAKYMDAKVWPKPHLTALSNWEEVLKHNVELLYEMEDYIKGADAVVWQRVSTYMGYSTIQGFKEKFHKQMIVEIDDNAFHVPSCNSGFAAIQPGSEAQKAFELQLRGADAVIASTAELAKFYRKFNKKVFVVPNGIDIEMWKKAGKTRKAHKDVRIVWQGGNHHERDLSLLLPVIPKILNKYPQATFHLFGHQPSFLKLHGVVFHEPVPILDYPETMCAISPDIIVAPLKDDWLNRGRSNLRVLEAGILGVPVVATGNKALPYNKIIRHSGGGILADSESKWVDGLSKLIDDKGERMAMGARLRSYVCENYDLKKIAKSYKKILIDL